MTVTVRDLIEMLEDFDPDMEVRIAEQPRYPFEYGIEGVAAHGEDGEKCVYICEGSQIGYLSSEVWNNIW